MKKDIHIPVSEVLEGVKPENFESTMRLINNISDIFKLKSLSKTKAVFDNEKTKSKLIVTPSNNVTQKKLEL